MYRSSSRGFTLIELLVALTLMAIISAAVVTKIGPSSRQLARDTQRRTDINSIAAALEMYRNDKGSYPATTGPLVPNYMSAVPQDPKSPFPAYSYSPVCAPTCRTFSLCANGMEKPPATPYCVTNP